jgi:hypothetical protein
VVPNEATGGRLGACGTVHGSVLVLPGGSASSVVAPAARTRDVITRSLDVGRWTLDVGSLEGATRFISQQQVVLELQRVCQEEL